MKRKYYRFLYGETDGCFVHFGEVKDTKTGKQLAFGYLRSMEGHVNQEDSEHTLFLCLEKMDAIILGNVDAKVGKVLRRILERTQVDTLVAPQEIGRAGFDFIPQKTITLCLSSDQPERMYRYASAGWKLLAKSYDKGSILFAHGLSCTEEVDTRYCSLYAVGEVLPPDLFAESKMRVNMVKGGVTCGWQSCEGAVFGEEIGEEFETNINECTTCPGTDAAECFEAANLSSGDAGRAECLKSATTCDSECPKSATACDYEHMNTPNRLGTVLLAGAVDDSRAKMLSSELEGNIQGIRFVGICGKEKIKEDTIEVKDKRYFIAMDTELSDEKIMEICGNGLYGVPVKVWDGHAVCCCGTLTYRE